MYFLSSPPPVPEHESALHVRILMLYLECLCVFGMFLLLFGRRLSVGWLRAKWCLGASGGLLVVTNPDRGVD